MALVEALVVAACKAGVNKVKAEIVALGAEQCAGAIMDRHLGKAYDQTLRTVALGAFNVVRAMLAVELKRSPSDSEVLGLMAAAGEEPGFPFRAVRLIEAARRSPSERRREMLAAVLYGMPFTNVEESDRERVDMLVERLMPEDIDVLQKISALSETKVGDVQPAGCLAVYWTGLRLLRYPIQENRLTIAFMNQAQIVSTSAVAALRSVGSIDIPQGFSSDNDVIVEGVTATAGLVEMTKLGDLLLETLETIHARTLRS